MTNIRIDEGLAYLVKISHANKSWVTVCILIGKCSILFLFSAYLYLSNSSLVLSVSVSIIYHKATFCKYPLFLRMIRTDPVTGAFGLKITFKLTSILNAKLTTTKNQPNTR